MAWGVNEIECEECESYRFMVNPMAQGCYKIKCCIQPQAAPDDVDMMMSLPETAVIQFRI
jgi:hypothetical protein